MTSNSARDAHSVIDNKTQGQCLGPVCDLGNINGCPRWPACGCFERFRRKNTAESQPHLQAKRSDPLTMEQINTPRIPGRLWCYCGRYEAFTKAGHEPATCVPDAPKSNFCVCKFSENGRLIEPCYYHGKIIAERDRLRAEILDARRHGRLPSAFWLTEQPDSAK